MNCCYPKCKIYSTFCIFFWGTLHRSQKSKVTPNKYLFRVNILNLFWFEKVLTEKWVQLYYLKISIEKYFY